jgi:hypothetical protein
MLATAKLLFKVCGATGEFRHYEGVFRHGYGIADTGYEMADTKYQIAVAVTQQKENMIQPERGNVYSTFNVLAGLTLAALIICQLTVRSVTIKVAAVAAMNIQYGSSMR